MLSHLSFHHQLSVFIQYIVFQVIVTVFPASIKEGISVSFFSLLFGYVFQEEILMLALF